MMVNRLRFKSRSSSTAAVRPGGTATPLPVVSIIIPLYNHARFIAKSLESATAQGGWVREIVVVDDGSSDGSASVLPGLCELEPRIIFWSQKNRGAHAAINSGLLRATGDYLAILNSDDMYSGERLGTLVAALEADPSADIAASGVGFLDEAGRPVINRWHAAAVEFFERCGDIALALINGNFLMSTSNFLFRRRLLDEIGLFAPLRYAHDLDFALRVIAYRKRFALVKQPLLYYRLHADNTIREDHGNVRLEWAMVTAFFLTRIWDHAPCGSVDWKQASAIEDVLQHHNLTRAVHHCMTYLRHHPTETIERNPLLLDHAFHAFLQDCL